MKPINILYDIQHLGMMLVVKRISSKVSDRIKKPINMNICSGYELLEKLEIKPDYDIILMHVGVHYEGACRQADECRKLSKAILISESSMFPFHREEIEPHFDKYMHALFEYDIEGHRIEELLRELNI